jgi:hypothetical protein
MPHFFPPLRAHPPLSEGPPGAAPLPRPAPLWGGRCRALPRCCRCPAPLWGGRCLSGSGGPPVRRHACPLCPCKCGASELGRLPLRCAHPSCATCPACPDATPRLARLVARTRRFRTWRCATVGVVLPAVRDPLTLPRCDTPACRLVARTRRFRALAHSGEAGSVGRASPCTSGAASSVGWALEPIQPSLGSLSSLSAGGPSDRVATAG